MGSGDEEKWKEYAHELAPHKYEIGAGILIAVGIFYLIWIGYMLYKAIMVRSSTPKKLPHELSAEISKYTLTAVGLAFQYMAFGSYIVGKIVKAILIDTQLLNVTTCDSDMSSMPEPRDVVLYYYVETLFQVFAMLFASCMLTTFNTLLKYLKHNYYNGESNPHSILVAMLRIVIEIISILFISIIGVGIPVALAVLFGCILYKFVRFVLNCKAGYKLYKWRIQQISEGNAEDKDNRVELEMEGTQYGYITTVFCFGAGFYVAQLAFDPLASIVEASCTLFPDDRDYIKILFHFMNLLIWGSFALVAILFLPFFLPYTIYFTGLVCCPAPVLDFLTSARNCFKKPSPKPRCELSEPLLPSDSKIQSA